MEPNHCKMGLFPILGHLLSHLEVLQIPLESMPYPKLKTHKSEKNIICVYISKSSFFLIFQLFSRLFKLKQSLLLKLLGICHCCSLLKIQIKLNCFKLLQIALNCIRLINWLKQDEIGSNWIKLDQT